MRKLLLSIAAFVAFAVSPSLAADLPYRAPSPPPYVPVAPPIFTWTGCYGGVNAGGAWTWSDVTYNQVGAYPFVNPAIAIAFANALGSPSLHRTSFTGGGELGCNYQTGILVWGVETDLDYLHTNANYTAVGVLPALGTGVASTVNVTTDWLYTLRGRVGIGAGHALWYVTGGLAMGNENFSQTFFHAANATAEAGAVSTTNIGWTVGAGLEYAFTPSVSAKVEYLYVDLGSAAFASFNNALPGFTASNTANLRESIARVGLNYRFFSGF